MQYSSRTGPADLTPVGRLSMKLLLLSHSLFQAGSEYVTNQPESASLALSPRHIGEAPVLRLVSLIRKAPEKKRLGGLCLLRISNRARRMTACQRNLGKSVLVQSHQLLDHTPWVIDRSQCKYAWQNGGPGSWLTAYTDNASWLRLGWSEIVNKSHRPSQTPPQRLEPVPSPCTWRYQLKLTREEWRRKSLISGMVSD